MTWKTDGDTYCQKHPLYLSPFVTTPDAVTVHAVCPFLSPLAAIGYLSPGDEADEAGGDMRVTY